MKIQVKLIITKIKRIAKILITKITQFQIAYSKIIHCNLIFKIISNLHNKNPYNFKEFLKSIIIEMFFKEIKKDLGHLILFHNLLNNLDGIILSIAEVYLLCMQIDQI